MLADFSKKNFSVFLLTSQGVLPFQQKQGLLSEADHVITSH